MGSATRCSNGPGPERFLGQSSRRRCVFIDVCFSHGSPESSSAAFGQDLPRHPSGNYRSLIPHGRPCPALLPRTAALGAGVLGLGGLRLAMLDFVVFLECLPRPGDRLCPRIHAARRQLRKKVLRQAQDERVAGNAATCVSPAGVAGASSLSSPRPGMCGRLVSCPGWGWAVFIGCGGWRRGLWRRWRRRGRWRMGGLVGRSFETPSRQARRLLRMSGWGERTLVRMARSFETRFRRAQPLLRMSGMRMTALSSSAGSGGGFG